MEKVYSRINFENSPSTNTPINATNLNKMDKAVDDLDDRSLEINSRLEDVEVLATDNEKKLSKVEDKANENYELIYSLREETKEAIEELQEADNDIRTSISALSADFDTLSRTTSPAITEKAIGTSVSVKDTADGYVDILAHGKYEQDSTTGEQLVDIADFELVKPDTRIKSFNVGLLSAGTYHINIELSGTATRTCVKTQYINDSGNIVNDNDYVVLVNGDNVFTSSYDFNRLYFFIANEQTDGVTASIKNVMFSVNEAEYEKYTGGKAAPNTDYPQEIKKSVVSKVLTHNANLIDFRDGASGAGNGGVAHTNRGDGSYTRVGTATNQWGNQWFKGRYNVIPDDTNVLIHLLPGESYFVGGCALYSADENGAIAVFDLVYDAPFSVNPSKYPNGVKITGIRCQQMVTGTTYNDVVYPRIFHGTEDLGLMVYEESVATLSNPIELGGLNGVEDVLDAKEIKRRFATVVFDGSDDERWYTHATATSGVYRVGTTFIQDKVKYNSANGVTPNVLCTHYRPTTPSATHSCNEGITVTTTGYIMIYDENINTSDVSLWKAHLAEHPMTVVYELAEPTTEELPVADQIALHGLKSFDGVTYVETDSEVKPTIEVKCVLDTKAYIDRKFAELAAMAAAVE